MLLRMKNLLTAQPCATLERIQSLFESVCNKVKDAVREKKAQQLRHYLIQLDVLLRRSEALKYQFIMGGSINLSYYIDDEIRYCKGMLKNWE